MPLVLVSVLTRASAMACGHNANDNRSHLGRLSLNANENHSHLGHKSAESKVYIKVIYNTL